MPGETQSGNASPVESKVTWEPMTVARVGNLRDLVQAGNKTTLGGDADGQKGRGSG